MSKEPMWSEATAWSEERIVIVKLIDDVERSDDTEGHTTIVLTPCPIPVRTTLRIPSQIARPCLLHFLPRS